MEPARRVDRQFRSRHIRRTIVLSIAPAIALAVVWGNRHEPSATTWTAAAFFLAWIAGWMLADRIWFRRYRCPSCNTLIPAPTIAHREAADPILYFCGHCNIEWDTRLRESTD